MQLADWAWTGQLRFKQEIITEKKKKGEKHIFYVSLVLGWKQQGKQIMSSFQVYLIFS